jgi:nitrite reductase (NADH) small subunit
MAYDLGPADRIPPGEGRTFDLRTVRVAVFRTRSGAVHATQASCPHREGPLADGLVGDGCVVCPLHGYKYDLATGEPLGHSCGAIAVHAVWITADGRVLLSLD